MRKFYKTKNDLFTSTLEEKIDTLLFINSRACMQGLKNLIRSKNTTIEDFKEKNIAIGPLVYGEAYYHEVDEYYDVIGFLVESECEFLGKRMKTFGFRGIYFGKCHEAAPIDFDEADSLEPYGKIPNGLGDHVEILNVLVDKKEVDKCIQDNKIDINKYLKELGLLLAEKSFTKDSKTHSAIEV
ncbi:MAG: hypothetical protein PHX04_05650 [Bacilli bacterium]|nr:hypothetical protein [Bacilli bacterium]